DEECFFMIEAENRAARWAANSPGLQRVDSRHTPAHDLDVEELRADGFGPRIEHLTLSGTKRPIDMKDHPRAGKNIGRQQGFQQRHRNNLVLPERVSRDDI